jgi:asparagine synthase (glutamine-hydrolysing)
MAAIPLGRRNSLALPSMTRQYSEMEKACLFGGRSAGLQDSMRILKDDFETASTLQPVTQIQYAWSKQWLAEHLLMQSDRMSMCVSLELRVPFLDIRLVDLLFSMPDSHKVRSIGGTLKGKYLLRQFLTGRVPDEVFHRPKRGFQIPNISFINNELRSEITATLRDPQARIYGLMDRQQVEKRIARIGPVEGDCQKVWMLFVLEKWLRKWMG